MPPISWARPGASSCVSSSTGGRVLLKKPIWKRGHGDMVTPPPRGPPPSIAPTPCPQPPPQGSQFLQSLLLPSGSHRDLRVSPGHRPPQVSPGVPGSAVSCVPPPHLPHEEDEEREEQDPREDAQHHPPHRHVPLAVGAGAHHLGGSLQRDRGGPPLGPPLAPAVTPPLTLRAVPRPHRWAGRGAGHGRAWPRC